MTRTERLFRTLLAHYGPQFWWPADTPFEVMAGAVLVQNTSWRQAERAIAALRQRGFLSADAICKCCPEELAEMVRPSGTFRLKARTLKALAGFVVDSGGLGQLQRCSTKTLRERLLSIVGIGPESADAILLYAFERRVFVADSYSRRVLRRVLAFEPDGGPQNYDFYRARVESCDFSHAELNEFHALLVEHGKSHCRRRPRCETCFAAACCRFTGNPD